MKSLGMGGSIISRNLLEGRGTLKWCIREAPENSVDNGWRFLSDIDIDEYLSNINNLVVCDWRTVVELEPAVLKIFNMPIGSDLTLFIEDGKRRFVYTETGKTLT